MGGTDRNTTLCKEVFDVSVAEAEAEAEAEVEVEVEVEGTVEPDCITDDVVWESMAFICVHSPILSISAS